MTNVIETYVLDVTERAVKAASGAALTAIGYTGGALQFNVATINWETVGAFTAGAAILSILLSLGSTPVGNNGTASLVGAITQKVKKIMPTTSDGEEYTTFPGVQAAVEARETPVEPADGDTSEAPTPEPVTVEPVTPPLVQAPVTVTETVENNPDGTITINGVTYTKN